MTFVFAEILSYCVQKIKYLWKLFEYCLICCLNIFARKTKASYAKQTCQMYCSMTINNLETNYSCMRPWVRQNKCIPTGHINMFCLICSSWAKHTKTPRGYKIGCLFTNRKMGTLFVFGKLVLNAKFRSLYSQWVGVLETKQQREDIYYYIFQTFTQMCRLFFCLFSSLLIISKFSSRYSSKKS